ncbi:MAG TPA: AMP-binding protein, partial [Ramlibacter sp.]|nr:AMP-binding protein [Ramlibacter sp.]
MRPPPSTVERVEALALRQPGRPALREDDAELSYAQFHGVLQQCGLALQRLGVRRGDRVAVSGPGFGIQLALLLACEGLGAATASFQAEGDVDAPALFRQVQWVFSARPQAVPEGVHFVLIDDAFARRLLAPGGERPAWAAAELDAIQRISRTSGSSGTSKLMLLQRRAQEQWILNGHHPAQYGPHTRL